MTRITRMKKDIMRPFLISLPIRAIRATCRAVALAKADPRSNFLSVSEGDAAFHTPRVTARKHPANGPGLAQVLALVAGETWSTFAPLRTSAWPKSHLSHAGLAAMNASRRCSQH